MAGRDATQLPAGAVPRQVSVRRYKDAAWGDMDDVLSREVPVRVEWGPEPSDAGAAGTMGIVAGSTRLWAWPHGLADLALGHVLLDRVHPAVTGSEPGAWGIRHAGTVTDMSRDAGDGDNLAFAVSLRAAPVAGVPQPPAPMRAAVLLAAMRAFMGEEGLWDGTGCFHRAGVYDPVQGRLLRRAEDIGRHNCIDRLAGWAAREGVDLAPRLLLVSARVTASLFAKARRAGFSFVVSRSAVTTASVDMATEQGVTLVGFARDREERFTVFADAGGRVLE
ncbi:formate dehydrogenase accessory sulfurtransferase FdhD [Nitratidesulfovibrio sp. SRB-5]|uniref:formate dehydrogenase accessory sulfurtransferase FdhD n=1 Tax=Nitratidesulfovibrio sp. SRB-5 TaxID=2872636 RepID=UPI001026378D|nr:formate dehydrogenase accessory sulfurtransferase FdhD [Nitratidesulfovibrio sp. SRB-5]MBZ2172571.1 formate dehydrogenase accessory sulfurtransferase FdhD [Nitratidesulfovibrio sp. SRB-5]RXF77456.1 sufurtransferase FdhD [Desulfovibrio sp. DS-1]